MKVIFLDNDGVICLSSNWGTRHKKQKKWGKRKLSMTSREIPVEYRFDNFDKKAIQILNEILEETDAEIVVSSDWRLHATLEELGEYYLAQGIIKAPIGITNKKLIDCDVPNNFIWSREWDLEQTRSLEIHQYLKDNSQITHWVAVDDLNMGKTGLYYSIEFEHSWGLENFVYTPLSTEGIKQSGIKEKILNYLLSER
jgi:hypothetical protein